MNYNSTQTIEKRELPAIKISDVNVIEWIKFRKSDIKYLIQVSSFWLDSKSLLFSSKPLKCDNNQNRNNSFITK